MTTYLAVATDTAAKAQQAQFGRPCVTCKKYAFYLRCTLALVEGHVYSEAGRKEHARLSGMCEFCFDTSTLFDVNLEDYKREQVRVGAKELDCTCDTPCCEVDVGVGIINCGSQHCAIHGGGS